MALINRKLK